MSAQNYITALTDQQQIAALRQELAAKDREIAELRARVERLREESRGSMACRHDALMQELERVLPGAVHKTDSEPHEPKYIAEIESMAALLKTTAFDACDQMLLRAERDEARECVGRLYQLAVEYEAEIAAALKTDRLTPYAQRKYEHQIELARTALAATPEHLRK